MRLSYCTWGIRDLPIEKIIEGAAAIGYHGIELAVTPGWSTDLDTLDDAAVGRIGGLLARHGLVLSAVAGHTSMCDTDEAKNEANMQRLRRSIDLAADLAQAGEPPIMVSLVGGALDSWNDQREMVADRVLRLGEYAAGKGVILAVEPHSGTSFDTPEKAIWLMEKLDHPSIRVNFDISHFDIIGIEIDECVPQIAPWSIHTHVKDQRGRYPHHEFLTPGSGPFDFVRYLEAMHKAGYDGFIGMEVSVMVQRKPGYDPWVDAALGYYALRHAFNASGVPLEGIAR